MAADPEVTIGILHSLTGTLCVSEQPLINAALMAVDEINQTGGVLGLRIRPLVEDGASDATRFAELALSLIHSQRAAALFGCWTSACRKALKPIIQASELKFQRKNGSSAWALYKCQPVLENSARIGTRHGR